MYVCIYVCMYVHVPYNVYVTEFADMYLHTHTTSYINTIKSLRTQNTCVQLPKVCLHVPMFTQSMSTQSMFTCPYVYTKYVYTKYVYVCLCLHKVCPHKVCLHKVCLHKVCLHVPMFTQSMSTQSMSTQSMFTCAYLAWSTHTSMHTPEGCCRKHFVEKASPAPKRQHTMRDHTGDMHICKYTWEYVDVLFWVCTWFLCFNFVFVRF